MHDNRILREHQRRNEATRDRWETMTAHRDRVMRLLCDDGERRTSICVLGAGNGNDIDVARLAREYERTVLIDLDGEALGRAKNRLPRNEKGTVEFLGGVDVCGMLATFESWCTDAAHSDGDITEAVKQAQTAPRPAVGSFDVVCSTCILSQLIDSVSLALPPNHARIPELALAVRNRHIELILQLLNPGGTGVLVTDFVSSVTAPEMPQVAETNFPQAARRWIEQGNFFTGANPFAIREYFKTDVSTAPLVEEAQVTLPWRWDIGGRQFAVCAVTVRRIRT